MYRIGPFSSATPPRLFDVTDAYNVVEVTGFTYQPFDATHYELDFATDGGLIRVF